jgi:hypothetical protein
MANKKIAALDKEALDPAMLAQWAGHIAHQASHLSNYSPEALLGIGALGKGSIVNGIKKYVSPTRFGQAVTREFTGSALRTGAKGLPGASPMFHNVASLAGDYEVAENMKKMHALGAQLGPGGLKSMHNLAADKEIGKDWIAPAVNHLGPLKTIAEHIAPTSAKYKNFAASIPTEANNIGRKVLDYRSTPVGQVGKDISQGIANAPGQIARGLGRGFSSIRSRLGNIGKIAEENKMASFLKAAETENERAQHAGRRGELAGIGLGLMASGLSSLKPAFTGQIGAGGVLGRGAIAGVAGGALGYGAGRLLHRLVNGKATDKEIPSKEHKMASILDPKSAVYFRSGQLHKIAASLVGKDEVTIANAVAKIASDAYVVRSEKARIAEGLVALESI